MILLSSTWLPWELVVIMSSIKMHEESTVTMFSLYISPEALYENLYMCI